MSKQSMEAIVGRSLMDRDYRDLFFADPDQALASYELTKEERTALLSIDAETLDAFAERLGVQLGKRAGPALSKEVPLEE
jgi:hypothetical protein